MGGTTRNHTVGAATKRETLRRRLAMVKQEVEIMLSLEHLNIVTLFDTFEDTNSVFLVMELCQGGELGPYLLERQTLTEVTVSCIMAQVFSAVDYIHDHHVSHRDLKPANILLSTRAPVEHNVVKVVDFGIACVVEEGTEMRRKIGTLFYMAPQVFFGRYDAAADLWSCGTILFLLLCGYPPFDAATEVGVVASIQRGNYTFLEEDWYCVTDPAKDLIRSLLRMDTATRCKAKDALKSEWIAERAPGSEGELTAALAKFGKFQRRTKACDGKPLQNGSRGSHRRDKSLWDLLWSPLLACGGSLSSDCSGCLSSSSKLEAAAGSSPCVRVEVPVVGTSTFQGCEKMVSLEEDTPMQYRSAPMQYAPGGLTTASREAARAFT